MAMSTPIGDVRSAAFTWWAVRRARYNLFFLAVAGVSVFCMTLMSTLLAERLGCPEFSIIGLVVDGVLLLVALVVANLLYGLAPVGEWLIRPRNAALFRVWVCRIGLALTAVIVSLPVAFNVFVAAKGVAAVESCEPGEEG
jgi:hypothetical protein